MTQIQKGQLLWGDKPVWMGFAPSTLEVAVQTKKKHTDSWARATQQKKDLRSTIILVG